MYGVAMIEKSRRHTAAEPRARQIGVMRNKPALHWFMSVLSYLQ
jgi:hypothetical protein